MKKNYKFGTRKTYFSCLDIYEPSTVYNTSEEIHNSTYSNFARKPGSKLLTRYKIIKVLQENSFGFIYLVEKLNKNRKYIIKEFFPHKYVTRNDDDEMILNTPLDIESLMRFNYMQKFFMGEADNLEKISIRPHKNIIKIYSVEKNKNNTSYIIYPYEEGMTLQRFMEIKARMGKGELDKKEINKILSPLIDAVEHLHTLNIYHLNIKPENMLIKKDGSLLLSGFEASTFFNDEDSKTFCNAYTPQYAAPEQIRNSNFSNIGKESDIYAIGILLYRLITSSCPPSAKERIACRKKNISYDPYIPIEDKKELLEKYDIAFLWMIDKAMMLSPKDRFKNIASLRKAVHLTPLTKRKKIIKNKKNFLFYSILSLALIYIAFEGLSKIGIGSDDESEMTTVSKKIVKSEENISILEVENESVKNKENKYLSLQEPVKVKKINMDENISDKKEIIDRNETVLNIGEDAALEEEIRTVKVQEVLEEQEIQDTNETVLGVKDVHIQKEIKTVPGKMDEIRTVKVQEVLEIQEVQDTNETVLGVKDVHIQKEIKTVPRKMDEIQVDKSMTTPINLLKKKKTVIRKLKSNTIVKTKKSMGKTLKQRKKKIVSKKRIKKKTNIQSKKPSVNRSSSTHMWYCKAIGGNIRAGARHSDKTRAKNRALVDCRNKVGSKKLCRILNCFLVR